MRSTVIYSIEIEIKDLICRRMEAHGDWENSHTHVGTDANVTCVAARIVEGARSVRGWYDVTQHFFGPDPFEENISPHLCASETARTPPPWATSSSPPRVSSHQKTLVGEKSLIFLRRSGLRCRNIFSDRPYLARE